MKKWIYLSPHLDDAVYSCGGLIHRQVRQGIPVEIWTIFAGQFTPGTLSPFAQAIHERWGTGEASVSARRAEDAAACALLGVAYRHFEFQDVIYRVKPGEQEYEIINNEDLFRDRLPEDEPLRQQLVVALQQALAKETSVQLCVPLGMGNHIDHTQVRCAAEQQAGQNTLAYFADFPYVLKSEIPDGIPAPQVFSLDESDVRAWCDAISLYTSQASTFWKDDGELRSQVYEYWREAGGSRIWFINK